MSRAQSPFNHASAFIRFVVASAFLVTLCWACAYAQQPTWSDQDAIEATSELQNIVLDKCHYTFTVRGSFTPSRAPKDTKTGECIFWRYGKRSLIDLNLTVTVPGRDTPNIIRRQQIVSPNHPYLIIDYFSRKDFGKIAGSVMTNSSLSEMEQFTQALSLAKLDTALGYFGPVDQSLQGILSNDSERTTRLEPGRVILTATTKFGKLYADFRPILGKYRLAEARLVQAPTDLLHRLSEEKRVQDLVRDPKQSAPWTWDVVFKYGLNENHRAYLTSYRVSIRSISRDGPAVEEFELTTKEFSELTSESELTKQVAWIKEGYPVLDAAAGDSGIGRLQWSRGNVAKAIDHEGLGIASGLMFEGRRRWVWIVVLTTTLIAAALIFVYRRKRGASATIDTSQ